MFFKDPISILSEAAELDLELSTNAVLESEQVVNFCEEMDYLSEEVVNTAESVPVFETSDGYFTEMSNIASFMRDNDIKSIGEALDLVAYANGLEEKSVGLMIEAKNIINLADKAKELKNSKAGKAAMGKAKKATKAIKDLKKDGYKVMKKLPINKKTAAIAAGIAGATAAAGFGAKKAYDVHKAKKEAEKKKNVSEGADGVCPNCGKSKCECGDAGCTTPGSTVINECDKKKQIKESFAEEFGIVLTESELEYMDEAAAKDIKITGKSVDKDLEKLCVGKSEKEADKLLEEYYKVNRVNFRNKTLLIPSAIGTISGAVLGTILGKVLTKKGINDEVDREAIRLLPAGGASVGLSFGASIGAFRYSMILEKISEKIMDLKLDINKKRRLLEKMLRDINEDINDAKAKGMDVDRLIAEKKKIRSNLDRLESIEADKVISRKDSNS